MANSIELINKYLPLYEESLTTGALTRDLVNPTKLNFAGANKVKIFKMERGTPGTYNRATGYSKKTDINSSWQEFVMSQDRYMKRGIDKMDNEETQSLTTKLVLVEDAKTQNEEIDFYRISKIAATNNISVANAAAISNGSQALDAFDIAMANLTNNKVPKQDRICYCNSEFATLLKRQVGINSGRYITGNAGVDTDFDFFDKVKLIEVPGDMLYVGNQVNATTEALEPKVTASKTQKINFLLLHKDAAAAALKMYTTKTIPEELNADAREDVVIANWYHDIFVFDTMVKAIYLHPQVAA